MTQESKQTGKQVAVKPIDKMKYVLSVPSVQEQFENALGANADLFIASLIDLFSGDKYLQECEPKQVVMEALKAATLKLPINKNLGFAYVIAYKGIPQFQIGYKGLIQLALRTGNYRNIHADVVYEGELKSRDKLTGEIDLTGEPTSDKVIGYFAIIELINGFRKPMYWSVDEVRNHASRFSQAYNSKKAKNTPWHTNFQAMAIKTLLKNLLNKYGLMSIEMSHAISQDAGEAYTSEFDGEDIDLLANNEFIDIAGDEPAPSDEQAQAEPKPKEKTTNDSEGKSTSSKPDNKNEPKPNF